MREKIAYLRDLGLKNNDNENKINISDGGFVNGLIYLAYKYVIEYLKEM